MEVIIHPQTRRSLRLLRNLIKQFFVNNHIFMVHCLNIPRHPLPHRLPLSGERLDLFKARSLEFFEPDLKKFRGTGWGVVNAMADMIGHCEPRRNTDTYRENNWGRIMDGHAMMDKLVAKVGAMV